MSPSDQVASNSWRQRLLPLSAYPTASLSHAYHYRSKHAILASRSIDWWFRNADGTTRGTCTARMSPQTPTTDVMNLCMFNTLQKIYTGEYAGKRVQSGCYCCLLVGHSSLCLVPGSLLVWLLWRARLTLSSGHAAWCVRTRSRWCQRKKLTFLSIIYHAIFTSFACCVHTIRKPAIPIRTRNLSRIGPV